MGSLRHVECQFVAETVNGFYFCLCAGSFHLFPQILHLRINEVEAIRLVDVVAPYRLCLLYTSDAADD